MFLVLIPVLAIYLFHFLFFWIFPSTDSIFYWLFANFIKTGSYFAPHPYYYLVPSTMEPPLYSVFIFLADSFSRADIVIHFVQLAGIVVSGFLIYKIFKFYFSRRISVGAMVLFLLTPGHMIYSSNLVAEPLAVFFITLYLYILHLIINLKKNYLWPWLFIFAAIISLHRYNLLVFFLIAVFLFLKSKVEKDPPTLPATARRSGWAGLLAGLTILAVWILINNRINGSWGLSNAEGKHLYNRILHFDRILPPQTHPAFIRFRKLAGERDDYFKPWWFYEEALIASTGSETEAAKVMQEFALAALQTHPLKYLWNTAGFFIFAHNTNPTYSDPLYIYSGNMKNNCQGMGNIRFCQPIIKTGINTVIWDNLVGVINFFYLYFAKYINYLILFPAIIYSLIQKDRYFRFLSVLYVMSILFFVLAEAPLPRYTYIFSSLAGMISYFALGKLVNWIYKHYDIRKRNKI
ncbi:hypothetical protein A2W14_02845 [Candidatus Gottesmanbacteria bacterium RBG_16_37_8]|uniref:Glycosyltransferase RgtA/B/C/D-like domain-containing protein n=1 Tax=Candidatus Gottesmanbacteria bacterium RBG_16_37_8 TaxID=1798371 RepID=A0A1F5YTK3_9BACT|nr:MAG: hypothetical protein A2W14_02845 [Candidatus Gottesmanbacteria bacterium RBG_16_37_8]